MAQRTYIPTAKEQQRLAEALRAEKIARLWINGGRAGDEEVEVVLEHSKEYSEKSKIFPCIDHYLVQVASDGGFLIKRNFCSDAIPPQPPEAVEPTTNDKRWYSLHPLFIPDTEVTQENPLWRETEAIEVSWDLANPRFDLLRRLLAQPSSEFVKKVREQSPAGSVAPEKWKAWERGEVFFQWMRPLEARLAGLVTQEKSSPSVQKHVASFAAAVTDPKLNPSEETLNLFLKLGFPEKLLGKILKKVRAVVFSEYPLLPEDQLDAASNKLTDWVCRRTLWEAAFDTAPKKPKLDPAKKMDPAQTEFFQTKLEGLFLNSAAKGRDVEDLTVAFQMIVWGLQQESLAHGDLFSSNLLADFADKVQHRFDEEIGSPVLKKLLGEKVPKLSEPDQKQVSERIAAVFPEGKLPMRWELLNRANFKDGDDLFDGIGFEKNQELRESMNVSAGMAITEFGGDGRKLRLTAAGASLLVNDLKKLERQGKPVVEEAGAIVEDQTQYLQAETARNYLKNVLALGEGENLEIETQARHLLEIAVAHDFAEPSLWTSPWLWVGVGGGAALAAGAAVFFLGGEESTPRRSTSGVGSGNGHNGNGNGNGNGPGPIPPDDGRGTPITVGP